MTNGQVEKTLNHTLVQSLLYFISNRILIKFKNGNHRSVKMISTFKSNLLNNSLAYSARETNILLVIYFT